MNKTVLICGGTGFAGTRITEWLVECGYDVTLANRGKRYNLFNGIVKNILMDRASVESIKNVASKRDYYNVIIDTIAMTSGDVFNLLGYFNCDKYIQLSSVAVYYGEIPQNGYVEDNFNPKVGIKYNHYLDNESRLYYRGKRFAECAAAQMYSHLKPTFIRPAYVTDIENIAHTGNGRLRWFPDRIIRGVPINPKWNSTKCSFTLTSEEAKIVEKSISLGYSVINVSSIGSMTIGELIEYCENYLGKKVIYNTKGERPPFTGQSFAPVPEDNVFRGIVINNKNSKNLFQFSTNINDWFFNTYNELIDMQKSINKNI